MESVEREVFTGRANIYKKILTYFFIILVLHFSILLAPTFYLVMRDVLHNPTNDTISIDQQLVSSSTFLKKLEQARAWFRYHILNVTPNNRFYMSKDGWFIRQGGALFEKGKTYKIVRSLHDNLGKTQLSQKELREWASIIETRSRYLKRRGIKYILAFIPRKTTIYPEIFPSQVQKQFKSTRLTQLTNYLKKNTDLPVVNLSGYLKRIKKKENKKRLLYLKTDDHWNQYGAYWGYKGLIDTIDTLFPKKELEAVPIDKFKVRYRKRWCHPRFTSQSGVCIQEPFPYLVPTPENPLSKVPIIRVANTKATKQVAQPPKASWRQNNRTNLLYKRGIGRITYPITNLYDKKKRNKEYKKIRNYGEPDFKRVLFMSASFGEKMLYYLASHAQNLYNYREVRSFDPHLLDIHDDIELVIQTIPQGAVGKKSSLINPDYIT